MGNFFLALWCWISANAEAVQAVLLILATIAAFAVIAHNAVISRREKTIDMVNEQFGDEAGHYEAFKTFFLDLEESGQALTDYAQLVEKLAATGVHDTEPNIRNKLARGKFTAVFLIQCLEAIGARELRLD